MDIDPSGQGFFHHQGAGNDERLLIGQCDGFFGADCPQGGPQSRRTDEGGQNN